MLRFSQSVFAEMRQHAEHTYPDECCGVLLGQACDDGARAVTEYVRCENTRTDSPETRYSIAPRELVRIMRESRERGLQILGFYHSHPEHSAQWSKTDLEQAYWDGCSYVITSVIKGATRETRSFLLDGSGNDRQFLEETIEVH